MTDETKARLTTALGWLKIGMILALLVTLLALEVERRQVERRIDALIEATGVEK